MASPAIVTEASGIDTDATNGVTASFSGTAIAGELLIVVFNGSAASADGNWTTPTGYTELIDSGEQAVFYKAAAGGRDKCYIYRYGLWSCRMVCVSHQRC